MTSDSVHLPTQREIQRAINAVNEAEHEQRRMRHLLTWAIVLIAIGAVLGIGANIAISAAGDDHLDWVRHWKGTAHWVGVSGVVMLGVHLVLSYLRRREDRRDANVELRLGRLERVCPGAEDTKADGLHGVSTEVWQHDVAEAYRLGQQNPNPPND